MRKLLQCGAETNLPGGGALRPSNKVHSREPGSPPLTMKTEQKALLVRTGPEATHGLDDLNVHLSRGWRVVHLSPMGAAGVGSHDGTPVLHFAALVVVERVPQNGPALREAEEAGEALDDALGEVIEELVEGDGSGLEVDPPGLPLEGGAEPR